MSAVDYNLGRKCIDAYVANPSDPLIINTNSVSFDADGLTRWISGMANVVVYDKIELHLGFYTQEFVEAYGSDHPQVVEYRMTTFICLYNQGQPAVYAADISKKAALYNLGELK